MPLLPLNFFVSAFLLSSPYLPTFNFLHLVGILSAPVLIFSCLYTFLSHHLPWGLSQHLLKLIIRLCAWGGGRICPHRGQRITSGIWFSSSTLLKQGLICCFCHETHSRTQVSELPGVNQHLKLTKILFEYQFTICSTQTLCISALSLSHYTIIATDCIFIHFILVNTDWQLLFYAWCL